MRTFYIIRLMDGRYLQWADRYDQGYCIDIVNAGHFQSEEEAIEFGPLNQPFTIIKFYDK